MKPTNLRLHSKASRLISRACGQTWRYLHDWPLLHFPSSNNVLGKWGGQKRPCPPLWNRGVTVAGWFSPLMYFYCPQWTQYIMEALWLGSCQ